MGRFTGKVAIVTGGASGIGEATCRRIVAEGGSVAIADINADRANALARELGAAALAVRFDAADVSSIEALVATTVAKFGRLDILHNNAAIVSPEIHARDTTAVGIDFATWDLIMAVNVRGYLAGCKYAIPHMIAAGGGAIVNTASAGGLAGDITRIGYNVSKSAVIGMTRQVATQHGRDGIRCNVVCPGMVLTPGLRETAPEVIEIMDRHLLVKQAGEASDIANLICFLASDDSRYINGQVHVIDGGMLAHLPINADLADYIAKHHH